MSDGPGLFRQQRLSARRWWVVAVAALAIALLGTGCGGESGSTNDQQDIENVLRSVLTTNDPAQQLDLFSADLRARLQNSQFPSMEGSPDLAEVLHVSNVVIEGDVANADVTRRYPDLSEHVTTYVLVREEGKWRFGE